MADADPNKALLVTGRLSYGCDDLSEDWPHGGTGLGLVGSIFWQPPAGQVRLPAEEDGGTRAILYTGGDAVLGASVEGWDDSVSGGVLASLFPSHRRVNSRVVLEWPGQENPTATATASAPRTFTYASAGSTITASSGNFVTDGFAAGMSLISSGTSANNATLTITNVAAMVLTVQESLTDEGPLSSLATLEATTTDRTYVAPGSMFPALEPLVFTPTNHVEHPALIVYRAIVCLEASAQLRLGSYRYLSVPILCVGSPDDDGRVAALGRLTDLEL